MNEEINKFTFPFRRLPERMHLGFLPIGLRDWLICCLHVLCDTIVDMSLEMMAVRHPSVTIAHDCVELLEVVIYWRQPGKAWTVDLLTSLFT